MNDPMKAYTHTLLAICFLSTLMAFLAFKERYTEALGFGGIVVGLIGVIRAPSSRSVTVDNTASDPVPVEPSK